MLRGQFMNKKNKLSQADQFLFDTAMKDVKPLPKTTYAPAHHKKKKLPTNQIIDEYEAINYQLSDVQVRHSIQSDEKISYCSNGVQAKFLRKLRTGKIPIEDHLDLHGLTTDQARQQVSNFIYDCQSLNYKCVIIIHGKGSIKNPAILKSMLNHWLRQIPDVLAFSSAQEQHGGNGAVYVLIKTKSQSDQ